MSISDITWGSGGPSVSTFLRAASSHRSTIATLNSVTRSRPSPAWAARSK